MAFWSSFFRETGKNTGKWASNKIFGDGWSTPFRGRITRNEMRIPGAGGNIPIQPARVHRSLPDGPSESEILFDKADDIQFDSNDVQDITSKLDALLMIAHRAIEQGSGDQTFRTKIRSGIQRLRRLGDADSAGFYEDEYKKVARESFFERLGSHSIFIIAIVLTVLGFWAYYLIFKAIFS